MFDTDWQVVDFELNHLRHIKRICSKQLPVGGLNSAACM